MKRLSSILLTLWLFGCVLTSAWSAELAAQPASPSAPATTRAIPFKHEPQSMGGQATQTILTLLLLIGLAAGGLYAAKKYLPRLNPKADSGKRLALIEVLHLTPKTTIFVVRFDGTTLLLGQHGESISVLSTQVDDPQAPQLPQA